MTETMSRVAAVQWVVCPGCRALVYGKRFERNLRVCPQCNTHDRVDAHTRIEQLLDPGSVRLLDLPVDSVDPLGFVDSKPYPMRLRAARAATGLDEAVVCARGTVLGLPVVLAVMDFRFLGGSLGSAVGELITQAAETALADRTPLLIVTASGGARMQEGALSLMQMAKTAQALGQLDEAGVLTVSLITDPTYGGVAASFATLTDVIIAEPGARLGFAGRRVIEQTIRQELPEGFQTAEFLLEHGLLDTIVPRGALRPALARLLYAGTRPAATPVGAMATENPLVYDYEQLPQNDPWRAVRRARGLDRPTSLDYVRQVIDDFEELHGDRLGGECSALIAGVGRLDDIPVMVVGHQKGHTIQELTARSFGMPSPAGYRKAARMMRLAAKLGIPVLALIDTPGAHPGLEAETNGQAVAIAENLRLMAGLPVPVVSVVCGEGGSGGALALGVADRVLIWSNAVYSVISPEGCAAILWKDPAAAPAAAEALRIGARDLLRLGIVDGVIPEPDGGTESDHLTAGRLLKAALVSTLWPLLRKAPGQLIGDRRARFRAFGTNEVRELEASGSEGA